VRSERRRNKTRFTALPKLKSMAWVNSKDTVPSFLLKYNETQFSGLFLVGTESPFPLPLQSALICGL